jgi:tetratricopeptide (TPR) repeat protein
MRPNLQSLSPLWLLSLLIAFPRAVLPATVPPAPPAPTYPVIHLLRTPTIDGKLGEWQNFPAMHIGLTRKQAITRGFREWYGPLDCSASAWLGWNEQGLFFAADAVDDRYWQDGQANVIWENDSIELALDPKLDRAEGKYAPDDREYWWGLEGDKTVCYCYQGEKAGERPDSKAVFLKKEKGNGWTFESFIPWAELKLKPKAGAKLGFSWVVNDSDQGWFENWLEWTPGLASKTNPALFGTMALSPKAIAAGNNDRQVAAQFIADYRKNLSGSESGVSPGESYLWIGHVQSFRGDFSEAEKSYHKALQLSSQEGTQEVAVLALARIAELQPGGKEALLSRLKNLATEYKNCYRAGYAIGWKIGELAVGERDPQAAVGNYLTETINAADKGKVAEGMLKGALEYLNRPPALAVSLPFSAGLEGVCKAISAENQQSPLARTAGSVLADIHLLRGYEQFENKYYFEAAAVFWEILQQPDLSPSTQSNALYYLALSCQETHQLENAMQYFETLIHLDPDFTKLYEAKYQIGVCCFDLKNYPEASKHFKSLLADQPKGFLVSNCEQYIRECEQHLQAQR